MATLAAWQVAAPTRSDQGFDSPLPSPTDGGKAPSPTATTTPGPGFDSPIQTPTARPTHTPTRRWNWQPTATALARITPTPYPIATSTPVGGATTPTPALESPPPTMVPSKAFRAENLEAVDVRFVDFEAHFEFVDWSPDGSHILVEVADPEQSKWYWRIPGKGQFLHDLWMVKIDGKERQKVAAWVGSATWSPDGKHIAYSVPAKDEGTEGEIHVVDVGTLKSWKVADSDFTGRADMYWLPDDELTFLRGGYVFAVRIDDKEEPRRLNDIYIAPESLKQLSIGLYRVSPDGKKIAWVPSETPGELWVASLDGSQAKMITDRCNEIAGPQGIAWSRDSQYLAFTVFNGRGPLGGDLWIASADGSDSHPVVVTEQEGDILAIPTWSPDGQAIAFTRGVSGMELSLWIVNRDRTNLQPLAEGRTGTVLFPNWSPTGSQIAYTRENWEPSGRPNVAIVTLASR